MRKTNTVTHALDDLLKDVRLARLFSKNVGDCALQLWLLQIKTEQQIENRIIYGRLLPYSHSSNLWYSSDDDGFQCFRHVQAQVIQLNLYIKSDLCANFLLELIAGKSISAISEILGLEFPEKLKKRFGSTALTTNLVFRPVIYLLNRDAYDRRSPSSPHGEAGAYSASITPTDKRMLFRQGLDYDVALTASIIKRLNNDTGLNFGGSDATRFGDIELLVFPSLDDLERSLLNIVRTKNQPALIVRFNPIQMPSFKGFQFRLCITNDGQVIYSGIAVARANAENVYEYTFKLEEYLDAITDSTELEVYGLHGDHLQESTLCCRWQMSYCREIHLQGNMIGNGSNPVKFDWLEKTTRPTVSGRVKAALTINRDNQGFDDIIGGRKADPWVPLNQDLVSLFSQLQPPRSEGQFFLRWGQYDGEGRLQFVEWFKALLAKYQQHQIVIFDPYFEDVGLGLLLICAASKADYIVFTSLPKPSSKKTDTQDESEKTKANRINNLIANCEHNRQLLKRIKLRIFGLKEKRLHDRYILVIGRDGLPVAGFNLSNSFQKAAEKYPLLVTPIPSDVLLKVEQYASELIQETKTAQSNKGENDVPAMQLLFDTKATSVMTPHYEPFSFFEKKQVGDVLSVWTGEVGLQGLSGDLLKEKMAELGLLKETSLALCGMSGLLNCLKKQQTDNFTNFTQAWEVLGEILAHSHIEENYSIPDIECKHSFMDFLAQYLETSFSRAFDLVDRELLVIEKRFFQKPIDALLHSAYHPHHLFYSVKYSALTWTEFYSIKILWQHSPDALLSIAEAQMADLTTESQSSDVMRLSLLSQIVSEISLSIEFGVSDERRDLLVRRNNGLLQWLGLNAIEKELEKSEGLTTVLQLLADFDQPKQINTLGWMINRAQRHAERNPQKIEIYKGLVAALHQVLPKTIPGEELKHLTDSLRGHMQQLVWTEPWLFRDVVFPLLQDNRVNNDDACKIWVEELVGMLNPAIKNSSLLFNRAREGQATNISAFLFAYSSSERQQSSLKLIQAILKRQQQVIQKPLASTSNWSRWDDALTVSIWILAFTRWSQYYLCERGVSNSALDQLSLNASKLTMARSSDAWQSNTYGQQSELVKFLSQVEGLLDQNILGLVRTN